MAMMSLNPKAEMARSAAALEINIGAARNLSDVMKSNLGPKGTVKMLVSGAGDIKLTKDGNVLLNEMSIQHPTASMIAKVCTAQDDITGDGTTSTVILIGELLRQAESYVFDGLHPRIIVEGFEYAKKKCLEVLDFNKVPAEKWNRETLTHVARTSLRTKLPQKLADHLSDCIVEAVLLIRRENEALDLHMVEIMEMPHRMDSDTELVRGLVLDHGSRHPDMPKRLENAYILTLNVSLEYEKTEVNSGFFYKSSAEREKLLEAERDFIEKRVQKIVDLKNEVCSGENKDKGFVVINQKGIDPPSLDMLAKAGIMGLRRAKRRNMERLTLACGGEALNALDSLNKDDLGFAGLVYEHVLGEEKYTFVTECANPQSCTILLRGPNKHSILQMKDGLRDGLRAVQNTVNDGFLIPGAGAFEVAAYCQLIKLRDSVKTKARLGIQAFADALLVIPKTLASNANLDIQDTIVKLQDEHRISKHLVGLDINTGTTIHPADMGIWDNYCVKKNMITASFETACNLLLVDEVMKAGMSSLSG